MSQRKSGFYLTLQWCQRVIVTRSNFRDSFFTASWLFSRILVGKFSCIFLYFSIHHFWNFLTSVLALIWDDWKQEAKLLCDFFQRGIEKNDWPYNMWFSIQTMSEKSKPFFPVWFFSFYFHYNQFMIKSYYICASSVKPVKSLNKIWVLISTKQR